MLGIRQRQILNLLVARGDLCVEIVLQQLGGNRRCGQLTLEKLAKAGLVQITGRQGRKGLPSAVVELCGPRGQRPGRGRDQRTSWRVRHDGTHYYVERGRVRRQRMEWFVLACYPSNAGRRYQTSRRGRLAHAERSRRYRFRCKNVTHHGSPSLPPDDLLSSGSPAIASGAPALEDRAWQSFPRCDWCGTALSGSRPSRVLAPPRRSPAGATTRPNGARPW